MKTSWLKQLTSICLLLLITGSGLAQQSPSISQLEMQIAEKEAVDHDPSTSPEVKKLNREFLNQQRRELRGVIAKEIVNLQTYESQISHSEKEKSLIAEKILSLQTQLAELEKKIQRGENPSRESAELQKEVPSQSVKIPVSFARKTEEKTKTESSGAPPADAAPASSSPPQPASCDLSNVPDVIKNEVTRKAADIVRRNDAQPVGDLSDRVILFSVIDALTQSDVLKLSALEAYTNIGQTTRTDKQLGSTASAGGSTSAIEKPGWSDLLGFAIEHGAIQQQVGDTTLTLSTTPYAFFVPSQQDTAAANRQYGYLKRVGLSASFNISDKNNPLNNVKRNKLSQYSAKLRLSSERGPNSREFDERWNKLIKPAIQSYLNSLTGGIATLFDNRPEIQEARDNFNTTTFQAINQILTTANIPGLPSAAQPAAKAKAQTDVSNAILCSLKSQVFDQTRADGTGPFKIDKATRDHLVGTVLPSLIAARKQVGKAKDVFDQMIEDFEKKPEASISFVNNRPATGTEYGTLNFLYQRYFGDTIKMTFNAGPSFYHRPDPKLNQSTFRDFVTTLSFEGRRDSPFKTTQLDLSPMTYSLTARYQRLQENKGVPKKKADLAVVQFKLDIPISKGFSVPLSLTYANATEQIKEKRIRGNFGITFDVDKFLAVKKLLSLVQQ